MNFDDEVYGGDVDDEVYALSLHLF